MSIRWFRGALDPERYERVIAAIEAHMTSIAAQQSEPVSKDANLAARALHELVTGNRDGGRPVPTAGFIIDYQTLTEGRHDDTVCETVEGRALPVQSVGRMVCDAVLRRVVLDDRGVPIDVGRRHRTATDAQWAATKAIYSTCGWDRCERPILWCQLHHIHHWDNAAPAPQVLSEFRPPARDLPARQPTPRCHPATDQAGGAT